MDQEETLAKSREENCGGEQDQEMANKASMFGFIGMSAAYVVMLLLEIFLKGRAGYGYIFLFSVFLASNSAGRYKMNCSKVYLFTMVCWIVCAVVWLALYLWRG